MAKKKEKPAAEAAVVLDDAAERREDFAAAVALLKKKHGDDSFQVDHEIVNRIDPKYRAETGLISLDYVTCGGLVRGAGAVQLHAPESIGKSTIALLTTAHFQNVHHDAVHWSCSELFNKKFAYLAGCKFGSPASPLPPNTLPICLTENVPDDERLIDVMQDTVKTGAFGLEVVDSIAALRPKEEAKQHSDRLVHAGRQPSMVNRMIAKMRDALHTAPRTCILLINQVRDTQDIPKRNPYKRKDDNPQPDVPDTHYPAGRFLRHWLLAAISLSLEHHIVVERGGDIVIVGKRILLEAEKLKLLGGNGWKAYLEFYTHDCPEHGFKAGEVNHAKALREVCETLGIIKPAPGARYEYGKKSWHGALNTEQALRDPELAERLREDCRAMWREMAVIPDEADLPEGAVAAPEAE